LLTPIDHELTGAAAYARGSSFLHTRWQHGTFLREMTGALKRRVIEMSGNGMFE